MSVRRGGGGVEGSASGGGDTPLFKVQKLGETETENLHRNMLFPFMNVMRWSAYPPSENRMTDTSENITFPCGRYQKWHTYSIHQMSHVEETSDNEQFGNCIFFLQQNNKSDRNK